MSSRVDDLSISDDERLWRRILPIKDWIKRNADGSCRPSSMAFKDQRTGELSVNIASLTTAELILAKHPDNFLAEIQAHVPRSFGHAIVLDRTPDDQSHALICSEGMSRAAINKAAKEMANSASWIVEPPATFFNGDA